MRAVGIIAACTASLTVLLSGGLALASVPLNLPLQGVIRDNAGVPVVEDVFEVTFSLYDASDAVDPVWTETWPPAGEDCAVTPDACVHVVNGRFRLALGAHSALDVGVLEAVGGLWLGMSVEGEPELARRPLGSAPYALLSSRAAVATTAETASGLNCTGCIAPEALSNETVLELLDTTLLAVQNAGYITDAQLQAAAVPYDGTGAELSSSDVQSAIDELKALIEEKTAAGPQTLNEGAGTVSRYTNQWGLPSYGVAREYVHLLNPGAAKLILHLYGGQNTGFSSSNNLIVSNTYTPNTYSGGANGDEGSDTISVYNAGAFNPGDHILIHQTVGNDPGHWELNAVKGVQGSSITLAKPLAYDYVSHTDDGIFAQVVIAASFNQLEVVNGGLIRPSEELHCSPTDNFGGGIVYIRAQSIAVKNGGRIDASGGNHDNSWGIGWSNGYGGFCGGSTSGSNGYKNRGRSECSTEYSYEKTANCSGGGGGRYYGGSCHNDPNQGGGGGGNQTHGEQGKNSNGEQGQAGLTKGSADGSTLEFGGGGGGSVHDGGRGGGLIVLGAKTIIVDGGGVIRANGGQGSENTGWGCSQENAGGGGGAGGTVALFAESFELSGTVETLGGAGGEAPSSGHHGGDGGQGWVLQLPPISGIVNQSFATGVQIWVDGQDVTGEIGDPNGKGSPHWDAEGEVWGATGTAPWSSGPLDISNAADWTLGEHLLEFKETGGAGGDLKSYLYVVRTYSEAVPPVNNSCTSPVALELGAGSVVVSGSTEDVMGKLKATDDYAGTCGGAGGPDAVYRIDLAERSLVNVATVAPHDVRMYLRADSCVSGSEVYCAVNDFSTTPLEEGTYYLFVDGDTPTAKGDYTLAVSLTPALIPANDTCDSAIPLVLDEDTGVATFTGSTLYALDQHESFCGGVDGPDVVHSFHATPGQNLVFEATSPDFQPILHLYQDACAETGGVTCSFDGIISTQLITQEVDFWVAVDSAEEKGWGEYTITVTVQ